MYGLSVLLGQRERRPGVDPVSKHERRALRLRVRSARASSKTGTRAMAALHLAMSPAQRNIAGVEGIKEDCGSSSDERGLFVEMEKVGRGWWMHA